MILLIDGDHIMWSSAGAGQKTEKGKIIYSEPVENSLHTAKEQMTRIIAKFKPSFSVLNYELYIGGGGKTFRHDIATIKSYKGSRENKSKPVNLPAVKEYLIKYWDAQIIYDQEVDDVLGIKNTEYGEDCIMCHIDKDLNMLPGKHYNVRKDLYYEVSEVEGYRHFCRQLLTGDTTDDIPTLCKGKTGPSFANKHITDDMSMIHCIEKVIELYKQYHPTTWIVRIIEVGRLLWIRRHENEMWSLYPFPYSLRDELDKVNNKFGPALSKLAEGVDE